MYEYMIDEPNGMYLGRNFSRLSESSLHALMNSIISYALFQSVYKLCIDVLKTYASFRQIYRCYIKFGISHWFFLFSLVIYTLWVYTTI